MEERKKKDLEISALPTATWDENQSEGGVSVFAILD